MSNEVQGVVNQGGAMATDVPSDCVLEPYVMTVLSARLDGIAKHMTHVVQSSARSSTMSGARDLSTAICDKHGDPLALPDGFPVHVANMGLTIKALMKYHGDDIRPGDAYLNNSPYDGNTHMGDHTIIVPVFREDELVFFCVVRGHQADIGNSVPTTLYERCRDVYEEGGLCFPCVRVQRDYTDVEDVVRMAKARIRVPEVWHGDYLAMVGAGRIGERSLLDLVDEYGADVILRFCDQWQEYGRRRMMDEIGNLPAGSWTNESIHDGIPGLLPEGVSVKVRVSIEPTDGIITVDFRGNGPPVPCGLNLCEATVLSAGRSGIMNRMPLDVPLCEGAMSRIVVLMDDPGVVGKAISPYSCSVATTNVANHAILAVQCVWSQIDYERGMAEGSVECCASESIISGWDSRYNGPYVTMLLSGVSGGMGVYGHDGWVTYGVSGGGMCGWNSVEIVEQKYPIRYVEQSVVTDSGGAGRWDGAPATRVTMAARDNPVTFMYLGDGKDNPARGVAGGHDGSPTVSRRYKLSEGQESAEDLPMFTTVELQPGEALLSECSSGGGYGDPLERDPEMVRHRVEEGWVSEEKARQVYGVVLARDDSTWSEDESATAALRQEKRAGQ